MVGAQMVVAVVLVANGAAINGGGTHSDDRAHRPDDGLLLSDPHRQELRESGISDDVARERCYRTETDGARLKSLHLPKLAGLLIPLWNVYGERGGYQLKPYAPRTNKRGDLIKYETPYGSPLSIDVHSRLSSVRPTEQLHPDHPAELPPLIADPRAPLVVTEGIKKADSAVTIGLCAIGLMGVFGFRGRNIVAGVVALAAWESIALKGRAVYICFDSDVMVNPSVYAALVRLGRFLTDRGAQVFYIYLSVGPHGQKVGLDDYIVARLAESLTHEQIRDLLLAQGTGELRKPAGAANSTTDSDLIAAAIKNAEAEAAAPIRAQYLDLQGRLVHSIPLKDKLLLLKSGEEPEAELLDAPEVLPTRTSLSPDGMRRYLAGERSALHDLLDRIHNFIKARLICRYPWQARLLALWIFGTYLYCLFLYFGYVHAAGPSKRAGKSLLLEILSITSFNGGPIVVDPTPAIIFRDANRNRGTQCYDELEGMQEDKEKYGAITGILNAGFKRGATVPRIVDPKTDTLVEFDVYSPKCFASIKPLSDTTADRSFRIELLRKKRDEKTASAGDARALAAASALRDDCHIVALANASSITDIYTDLADSLWPDVVRDDVDSAKLPSPAADNRARDILLPLFAIAIAADAGCESPTWYPAMLDATSAIVGARGDTSADEVSLVAAAQALKDYSNRETFAITGQQAFNLFKDTQDLGWIDNASGAKAILRKLGLRSGTHRDDCFAQIPPGSKPIVRGYLVTVADMVDFIARYQPGAGATAEEDDA